jgi:hypothetical protein
MNTGYDDRSRLFASTFNWQRFFRSQSPALSQKSRF